MTPRLCDVLVLVMTPGVSLRTWRETGLLARECAIYEALRPSVGSIIIVSDGDEEDHMIGAALDAAVVTRSASRAPATPSPADEVARLAAGCATAIVKTNQHAGTDRAIDITTALRSAGIRTALVARAGHLRSMNVGRQEAFTSRAAAAAAEDEQRLLHAADRIVVASDLIAELLCWRHALNPASFSIVPNYLIPPHELEDSTCPAHPTPGMILCAGRLHPEKRTSTIIDAVASLARPGVTLHIVGDGPLKADLHRQAAPLGAMVEFHGAIMHADLLRLMRRASIYVGLGAHEWHPKALLEAMAAGCTPIVADAMGIREFIRHRETGLIVEPYAADLRAALASLLDDPHTTAAMGAAASTESLERYAIQAVVPRELEALRLAIAHAEHDRAMPAPTAASAPPLAPAMPGVTFAPGLLDAASQTAAAAFANAIRGFTKRTTPRRAAELLCALDASLYEMQGECAIAASGGLHPKHEFLRFHDFFVDNTPAGDRVLDLGSGVGALACSIARRAGAHVTCIEINPRNAGLARERIAQAGLGDRITVVEGDITTHRAPGSYDTIVLSNVLEHLSRRPELLRTWIDWYSPRRFLIRVPAFDREWRVPWKKSLGVEWRLDPTHEIEHTFDQLRDELRAGGLDLLDHRATWGEYWVVAEPARGTRMPKPCSAA